MKDFRSVVESGELFVEPNVVILPDLPDGAIGCEIKGQYLTRAEVYRHNADGLRRLAAWHRDRARQERDLADALDVRATRADEQFRASRLMPDASGTGSTTGSREADPANDHSA